jgi:glycosyltransferase involved in cell wall biosynthesis
LRVALVKPDWKIRGGFELVVDRLVEHLQIGGHRVDVVGFNAWNVDRRPFGVRVDDASWAAGSAYFEYVSRIEKTKMLDVGSADMVISTQPPSFYVDHPRHMSVFFHHNRPYYELGPYVVAAGMVQPEFHRHATVAVRRIDDEAIGRVRHVLAGGETVAGRVGEYNHREDAMSVFHAGPTSGVATSALDRGPGRHVLCVSRHDFPKRSELFIHAARLAPELPAIAVGAGGRFGWVRQLDAGFSTDGVPDVMTDEQLWLNDAPWIDPAAFDGSDASTRSNITFETRIDDDRLADLYRHAHCLVAPALLEDYGLTVLEAMRYGVPPIVCSDGGHLCHFVEDERNGLIVAPTGAAIAAAARRLAGDADLRERLGDQARHTAQAYTWDRALDDFDRGVEMVMS